MNPVLRLAAHALEPRERETVLGDLAESGLSGPRALRDILGLAVRRQILSWTNWRPWFALIAVAGLSGFFLSRMLAGLIMGIFEQAAAWRRYGVHYNTGVTGFRDDVIHMSVLAAAIFCWTATNASLLRRLSGRAGWLTLPFFCLMVSGSITHRLVPPWWMAFLAVPAVCGMQEKLPALTAAAAIFTIAAAVLGLIRSHDLQTFSNGAFPASPWPVILVPYALTGWPVIARKFTRQSA